MSSEFKGTSGPWDQTVSGMRMRGEYGQPFAIYASGSQNLIAGAFGDVAGGFDIAKANAKLIAAAPDLLAACQKLVDYRRRAGSLNFQLEKCDDFIHMMKVAITAATGTQSEGE